VIKMNDMFFMAESFNRPINEKKVTRKNGTTYIAWDTRNVTEMYNIFEGTKSMKGVPNWYEDDYSSNEADYSSDEV